MTPSWAQMDICASHTCLTHATGATAITCHRDTQNWTIDLEHPRSLPQQANVLLRHSRPPFKMRSHRPQFSIIHTQAFGKRWHWLSQRLMSLSCEGDSQDTNRCTFYSHFFNDSYHTRGPTVEVGISRPSIPFMTSGRWGS